MGEETEKKVSLVETIYLLIIVSINSAAKIVADLVVGVPVIGEIVFMFADFFTIIAWAVVLLFFVIKLGAFGAVGIAQTIGGILDMLGIPVGLLGSTILGIYLANHPKVAAVAQLATGKGAASAEGKVAGEAASAEKAAQAGTAGEHAAEGAAGSKATENAASRGAQTTEGAPGKTPESGTSQEKPQVTEEAFGIEKDPLEKMKELMEQPLPPNQTRGENKDDNENRETDINTATAPQNPPQKVEDVRRKEIL